MKMKQWVKVIIVSYFTCAGNLLVFVEERSEEILLNLILYICFWYCYQWSGIVCLCFEAYLKQVSNAKYKVSRVQVTLYP